MAVQTKESLKKAGANILGAVINNIPENDHSHNGYGYYYGYDEESKSNSRRKPRLLGVREKAGRRDL
jgi:Mrp family chromosome partitioning ATPase